MTFLLPMEPIWPIFALLLQKRKKKIFANPQRLKMGRQCNTNNPLKIEPFQHI